MIPRIETRANSFRVFRGYKRRDLSETEFLGELGQVFMPGTPLMLRDLGLTTYLPAVLPSAEGVDGVPDEVAIIGYASQERYDHARNHSISGRMYTHTHRAVFDTDASRSQFPVALGTLTEAVTAFWCVGVPCDWQADGDVLVWAGHSAGRDGFAARFVEQLARLLPALLDVGVRECVGQVGPAWASLWLLLDGFGGPAAADPAKRLLRRGPGDSTELLLQTATRLQWRDQPPAPDVARPSAWSFIFVREPRHFLV